MWLSKHKLKLVWHFKKKFIDNDNDIDDDCNDDDYDVDLDSSELQYDDGDLQIWEHFNISDFISPFWAIHYLSVPYPHFCH